MSNEPAVVDEAPKKHIVSDDRPIRCSTQDTESVSSGQVTVIEPRSGWQIIDIREVWRNRELLAFLVWRDVKVRYKQTALGAAWAVIQPFSQMVVLSIFLGRMASMPTGGIPYPLFVFAGLLPWTFFSNGIATAANSVFSNQNLVTKVYFPRLFIPASAIGVGVLDFGIAFGMLVLLMCYYGVAVTTSMLLIPIFFLLFIVVTLGIGTLFAALTVAYRDFRYVVPFMVQIWMFATPAVYMDASMVGPRWSAVLPLNPAHGLILSFRNAALGQPIDSYSFTVSLFVSLVLFVSGCLYFRRIERSFADIV